MVFSLRLPYKRQGAKAGNACGCGIEAALKQISQRNGQQLCVSIDGFDGIDGPYERGLYRQLEMGKYF